MLAISNMLQSTTLKKFKSNSLSLRIVKSGGTIARANFSNTTRVQRQIDTREHSNLVEHRAVNDRLQICQVLTDHMNIICSHENYPYIISPETDLLGGSAIRRQV